MTEQPASQGPRGPGLLCFLFACGLPLLALEPSSLPSLTLGQSRLRAAPWDEQTTAGNILPGCRACRCASAGVSAGDRHICPHRRGAQERRTRHVSRSTLSAVFETGRLARPGSGRVIPHKARHPGWALDSAAGAGVCCEFSHRPWSASSPSQPSVLPNRPIYRDASGFSAASRACGYICALCRDLA